MIARLTGTVVPAVASRPARMVTATVPGYATPAGLPQIVLQIPRALPVHASIPGPAVQAAYIARRTTVSRTVTGVTEAASVRS